MKNRIFFVSWNYPIGWTKIRKISKKNAFREITIEDRPQILIIFKFIVLVPRIGFFYHILKVLYDKKSQKVYHIALYHIFCFSKSLSYRGLSYYHKIWDFIIFVLSYSKYDKILFYACKSLQKRWIFIILRFIIFLVIENLYHIALYHIRRKTKFFIIFSLSY